jgi:membrane-bound serine protease (ClpP class)
MVPGSNVVQLPLWSVEKDGNQAPDKYQSYMRSVMKGSTAESKTAGQEYRRNENIIRIEIEGVMRLVKRSHSTVQKPLSGFLRK